MKPNKNSQVLLKITRSKAKMYEYGVPLKHHIKVPHNPAQLLMISIGLVGELSASINRENVDPDYIKELHQSVLFSARFFDSYFQSNLDQTLDSYVLLLGSSAYYLCDLPGSSVVLAHFVNPIELNLDASGLESILLWLLQNKLETPIRISDSNYSTLCNTLSNLVSIYYKTGTFSDGISTALSKLRSIVYSIGTPRELLLVDIICAVIRRKCQNSSWLSLPIYTGLPRELWDAALKKDSFVKELWPSQHLFGESDVFRGSSAVIQMPTSAGKTKSVEIIIRSSFLAKRTALVVIVAPFRSLCHEIRDTLRSAFLGEAIHVDEFSDVIQNDYTLAAFLGHQQVLVATPEKLLYVLRHTPDLAENIGVIIYDEGHQFDNGTRGVTYELLLASLKALIPQKTQTVLISAVIRNAQNIRDWLLGPDGKIVIGKDLIPTERSIAFTSWQKTAMLRFVDNNNPNLDAGFVPYIIDVKQLKTKANENDRFFPDRQDSSDIALSLSMKLADKGGIAIFCGQKASVTTLAKRIVEISSRGFPIRLLEHSNPSEIEKLHYLYSQHLGDTSPAARASALGMLSHHSGIPNGVRHSVEYAVQNKLAKFIVCTSTLAQGVNLPIRYLIVTNTYQAGSEIKVRDFQNLIGRAGRSGMYTEGSIIFTNPVLYDNKDWRWKKACKLLDAENSEPCASSLLSIFDYIQNDNGQNKINITSTQFVEMYANKPKDVASLARRIVEQYPTKGYSIPGIQGQIADKLAILASVENYLMAHWKEEELLQEEAVIKLAQDTYAYSLATIEQKEVLVTIFQILARNIAAKIDDPNKRQIFGRTLYGVNDSLKLESWLEENLENLLECTSQEELLAVCWSLILLQARNDKLLKCSDQSILLRVAAQWIAGESYWEILEGLKEAKVKFGARYATIDHVVELCDNAFGFDGSLALGSLADLLAADDDSDEELIEMLYILQKRLKYGLSSFQQILLFEKGFADRVVAIDLSSSASSTRSHGFTDVKALIEAEGIMVEGVLAKYPAYYAKILEGLRS